MIEIANLSFKYGRQRLFSNLNLSLCPGGICGLLGKNGAGKTTLLKLLAGLLFPDKGKIDIYGFTPSRRPVGLLQDLIFLPEVFSLPPVTPLQYEKLYAVFYPRFSHERFRSFLLEFGIPEIKKLSDFSYGQKKKFLVAFGLASGCRLMLLDEPTNGFDIPSKSQFRKAVASSLTDDQIFIISTHQVRDLETLIDPVIILDEGRIVFHQSVEKISDRLKVTLQPDPPDSKTALYSEKRLDGYMVVSENRNGEVSGIDLETLFNTVAANQTEISRIFQDGGSQ